MGGSRPAGVAGGTVYSAIESSSPSVERARRRAICNMLPGPGDFKAVAIMARLLAGGGACPLPDPDTRERKCHDRDARKTRRRFRAGAVRGRGAVEKGRRGD